MAADDTTLYGLVFGGACTLAGNAVTAVVDVATELVIEDVLTTGPTAVLRTQLDMVLRGLEVRSA